MPSTPLPPPSTPPSRPPPNPGDRPPAGGAGQQVRRHPHLTFAGVTLVAAAALGGLAASALTVSFFAGLLWALGPVALGLMAYDKAAAGREWPRVPERVLLGLAVTGGAFWVVAGQRLLRHKTIKPGFGRLLDLIVAGHLLLAWLALGLWAR